MEIIFYGYGEKKNLSAAKQKEQNLQAAVDGFNQGLHSLVGVQFTSPSGDETINAAIKAALKHRLDRPKVTTEEVDKAIKDSILNFLKPSLIPDPNDGSLSITGGKHIIAKANIEKVNMSEVLDKLATDLRDKGVSR